MQSINILYAIIMAFLLSIIVIYLLVHFTLFKTKSSSKPRSYVSFVFSFLPPGTVLSLNNIGAELGSIYENLFLTLFYVLHISVAPGLRSSEFLLLPWRHSDFSVTWHAGPGKLHCVLVNSWVRQTYNILVVVWK